MLKIQSQGQDIHAKGQTNSSDEFSISSATANRNIDSNLMLLSDCIPQQQFKGGTSVVDPKSPDFK